MGILQEFLRQRALLQRMQELIEAMIDSDVMKRLCHLIAEIDF